jgi:tetratricopeptide (TPR) repeat protein
MNDPGALLRQAQALNAQGRRAEAIDLFRRALALLPTASEGWYELGYLLKAEGRYVEALDAYAQALARGISRAEEVHLNRGVIYSDHLRRDAEAERELHAALALNPRYVPALLNLGNLHEERGERDAALGWYERLLATGGGDDPRYHALHFEALARTAIMRPPQSLDDPLFARLRAAIDSPAVRADAVVRPNLLFALARSYERLGATDEAFAAFAEATRCLREAAPPYSPAHTEQLVGAMIAAFPTPVARAADDGAAGARPLFVCGMFRSGSTLVEQVLAGHPRIVPGGEVDFLMRLCARRLAPFPASMARLDPAREAQLAAEYRAHLARLFPQAGPGDYITDKRPDNFLLIGLIKRLLPAAKFVHSVRDPLDTGLSVFMQHLHLRVAGYASDLGAIGHYYGQYRRLMAHWKALYPDDIHDFDYDAFVREPRAELDKLFAFLGLDYDERVLEFHTRTNTVKTASYWQVRRPLYADASGRWRRYATHLAPLAQALRAGGVALDPGAPGGA